MHQMIVTEIVDQQRSVRHESARESRIGNVHVARRIRRDSHSTVGMVRGASGGPILFLLPIPCLRVGSGFTDRFDATIGPSPLVFALATLDIGRDAPVHDAGADPKTVPESSGHLR